MSTIKNSRFETPFGDLGVTHRVHLWLDGKRVVDFLLTIIKLFFASSLSCGTIKRNLSKSAFSDGGGSLWTQILGGWGRRPQSIYGPLERGDVATICHWKFSHTKKLCSRTFFDRSWNLMEKIAKSRFVPPFGELGVTYAVHLWLVGKRVWSTSY